MGQVTDTPYAEIAARLGSTEAALKMTVQRMRRRYAEILREEIANTVRDPQDIDAELRELGRVLSSR